MRIVQRRARELGLDTAHFRRNRTWTDTQLRLAIQKSLDWREVIESLDLVHDGQVKSRLKGHAIRLGLKVGHLEATATHKFDLDEMICDAMPGELRRAAPTIAAAWFTLRGLGVALPVEPQIYDLLVASPHEIYRVQVKSTTSRTRSGKWQVGISHRPDKLGVRIPYDPEDIDLFAVITGDGDFFLIPIGAVAGFTSIYLSAYEDYKVGDVSSLLN